MKFLITVLLLTSLSAFGQDVGEDPKSVTQEDVTQPCDGGKSVNEVTNISKTEGSGNNENGGPATDVSDK
jgi:hypothetical protein